MRRRRFLLALLAASTAAGLAACAPAVAKDWQPPASGAEPVTITAAPAPIDLRLDPGLTASFTPVRVRSDAVGIQVRAGFLPGIEPVTAAFNAALLQQVRSAIDTRAAEAGVTYVPTALPTGAGLGDRTCVAGSTTADAAAVLADPALGAPGGRGTAVVCDVLVASGTTLAERLRVVSGGPGAIVGDAAVILYVDTASGVVATADGLWTDAAVPALYTHVVDLLRRGAGSLSQGAPLPPDKAQVAAITAALRTTVAVQGAMVVTIPVGFTTPEVAGMGIAPTSAPLAVSVPADVAQPLLSPLGSRVLASSGQPFTPPTRPGRPRPWADCTLTPCVALTYDDGPGPFTAGILDDLAARDSSATFFAMGENAESGRNLLQRMVAEGYEVENHTWNHPHLTQLTSAQVTKQVAETTQALEAATGWRVQVFRPPYGQQNDTVLRAAGMAAILWDVETFDWQNPPDGVAISRAVNQPGPGSIVLLHDVQPVTARTSGATIDGLRDRGFALVTVEQLFGDVLPASGAWHRGP